jgi:hypothetical protein
MLSEIVASVLGRNTNVPRTDQLNTLRKNSGALELPKVFKNTPKKFCAFFPKIAGTRTRISRDEGHPVGQCPTLGS